MWIVRLALRRPYTFAVLALLIAILGALTIARTPTDIFPNINIPVVSVIWLYNGLSAQEMEGRIVTISERAMTTTVNGIEHIESQSLNGAGIGAGVIRVFFQPDATIDAAVAETTAINQTVLRVLPPGTTPPFVLRYSATNVPILQLALAVRHAQRAAALRLRPELHPHAARHRAGGAGAAALGRQDAPDHGRPRPRRALREGAVGRPTCRTPLNAQNVILPAGTAKMGPTEYVVRTNSSPDVFEHPERHPGAAGRRARRST